MSRHGYYKPNGSWEPANPNCFYGEDCEVCNPSGIYDRDDDHKPPWEYEKND